MDIPRPTAARNRRILQVICLAVLLGGVSAAVYGLSKMKPAAPSVERATVWIDTVKRGPMLREVHGNGTLVPEEFRWIPATRDGLVEQINVRIGDAVQPDTILIVMSNPDLQQSLIAAEYDIRTAEADLANTRAQLRGQALNHQTSRANAEATVLRTKMQADAFEELAKDGLKSAMEVKLSRLEFETAAAQIEMEKKRAEIETSAADAQVVSRETHLEQLRAIRELKKIQIEQLKVRAGAAGILQELSVDLGKYIGGGTSVAKLSEPGRLKARLKIAETQMKDIVVGQAASIDTRNGIVPGRVAHIDPAAVGGTVTVDVQLNGKLPNGARPDLSVDGTVEIERLSDVLYMGRPAQSQAGNMVGLFKLVENGEAVRVQVKLGRISVSIVEIVEGLKEGDRVILSEMSESSNVDRVKLR